MPVFFALRTIQGLMLKASGFTAIHRLLIRLGVSKLAS